MKKLTILLLLLPVFINAQDTTRSTEVLFLENKDTLIRTVTQISELRYFQYATNSVKIDSVRKKYKPPVANPPSFPVGCNSDKPKTYIISPTQPGEIYITNASGRGWKGGDTLKIMAGTYSVIEIDSFGGDPCRDIIVINSGGLVKAKTMRFQKDVHHVKILGNGVKGLRYGFQTGVFAFNRVNHFTMKHIEIGPNPSGVGIYGKQDPYVGQPWTHYGAYVSKNIVIDSNYVHDVDGEGMYIGHTYPGGDPAQGNRIPQRMSHVTISNNIVVNCGWDAIQLSNARDSCFIYGNTVTNFGIKDIDGQRAGIISGGNTNAQVYNNVVSNGMGNGIQFFGYGLMECYNNTITNVGKTLKTTGGEESIYGQANNHGPEVNPVQSMYIHDNQINYPATRGIVRFNATTSSGLIRFINNGICFATTNTDPMRYTFLPTGSMVTSNTVSCNGSSMIFGNETDRPIRILYRPTPSPVPDSLPPIPDSVQFMSKRHIQQSYKNLSDRLKPLEDKLTVSQYNRLIEGIEAAFGEVIRVATEDYNKKKKPVR